MKKQLLFLVLGATIGLSLFAVLRPRSADGPVLRPEEPLRSAEKPDLIRVEAPKSGEEVQSPLLVRGEARGFWFFEASFPVKVLDKNGEVLGIGIAEAQSEWVTENFVPFRAVVSFQPPKGTEGTLVLEKDNPSGLPENADELRMKIRFLR
ncbi:MAG: hypothetical protein HYT14_00055 [Candidatus Liptonbacteria bacterium]|nr:hypothetical protein [Candidatus Liptonbacteria bacterium]